MQPELDALKSTLRAAWTTGDFAQIGMAYRRGAEEFVERLHLEPGTTLLDVACGDGNFAIPAARVGVNVTGMDIALSMVEQARENAKREGLEVRFDEGDVEALQYADESFDMVVTMFGAMFAPRPDITTRELLRVCKRGGRLVMTNWTPGGLVGQIFKIVAAHVPSPTGMPSPMLWGIEDQVRERLGTGVSSLETNLRHMIFAFPFPPADVVDLYRNYFGPTQKAFGALDESGQLALHRDLERLWTDHNSRTDGTTEVHSEYLEVSAIRA